MGRPKGSKNKSADAIAPPTEAKGNPAFNIKHVEPTSVLGSETIAMSAITDEDMELERALQRTNVEEVVVDDPAPAVIFKKEKDKRHLLSDHMEDYKPASTINELMDQVHQAKEAECDSIEATPALVKYYCKKQYPSDVGYFMFHDIKVYIAGFYEQSHKRDSQTIEQKLFGDNRTK